MIKKKVYEKLKDILTEYVFDFDEKKFDLGVFGGNLKLNDLILVPSKINEKLQEADSPVMIKAGRISRAMLKVSRFK